MVDLKEDTNNAIQAIVPALLLVCYVSAYLPVWQTLFAVWSSSDDYSHGFFILPIIGYILWQKKDRLSALPKKTSITGFFLLFVSLVVYVLASYAEIKTISSLTLLTSAAGCILFIYGPAVLVPSQVYSLLTIPLQLIVTKISVFILDAIGVTILREGNVIHIPNRTFEVVQACSGMRSLVSLLTLGTIMSYFALQSNFLRGIVILLSTPIAIMVNIFRVIIMIIAWHYWGYDLTKGTVHTIFGLFIFLLAIAIIFIIQGVLQNWDKSNQ